MALAVGTGRLVRQHDGVAHIGRMAVLPRNRRHGVGSALIRSLLAIASEERASTTVLAAQLHAIRFYERHGFSTVGADFLEAGIRHRWMTRTL